MFININRRELVESLKNVLGPTTTKPGFSALGSVLIEAKKKEVKFTTTDLDLTIISLIKTEVDTPGKALVPMRRFISIARELSGSIVTIEKTKNILLIKCGKAEFKVNTTKEDEFPKVWEKEEAITVRLLPETLEKMINLTSFCVGYEDVNYVLSGVLFELEEDKIKLVATDGKRLSFAVNKLPENQAEIKEKISFILPNKTVGELIKITKNKQNPLYLSFSEKTIDFDFEETKVIARPIEGEFPDYSRYIPKEKGEQLKVNREAFIAALRRVGLFTTAELQGVKLSLRKEAVIVHKTTPQLGEAKEEIEASYQGSSLEIEFNPNYLLDVLKQISDPQITIDFFGEEKPAVLKREGHTYLLLPIKT